MANKNDKWCLKNSESLLSGDMSDQSGNNS